MYINTGYQRAYELKVARSVGGEITYTRLYSVLDAFGNYPAVTLDGISKISTQEYLDRIEAFKYYVEGLEVGVQVDIANARMRNEIACPIR